MKGRLQDRQLESLMRDLQSRGATGILTLARGAIKKQICFLKGTVRFAASNLREDRLAEFLVRSWALPEEQVRDVEMALEAGRRLADALVASGALTPEAMRDQVRAHTFDIICPCFEWKDGEYRFQDGAPNLVGEMTADIVALELALERVRRQVTGAHVEKVLSQKHMAIVQNRLPQGRDDKPLRLPMTEAFVLERAATASTLEDLLRLSPEGEYEIAHATAVLLQGGLIDLEKAQNVQAGPLYDTLRPGPKPGARSVQPAADAVPAEVRYYQQMHDLLIGADFYKTLGVDHDTSPEEVRRSYYQLAKEIHPDRFLAPPLDVLHAKMEELFSQVLEAYNTLVSPEARARYDTERAQAGTAPKVTASDQQMLAKQNFVRGKMLVDENKPAEALKWLQNAVDIEPNKPEYQRLLASVQAKNPRLRAEAESHFLKAIELDPARADTYLQLGQLYRKLGDVDKAVTRLRECLKWDPANAEAGTALAELTSRAGTR
jgi:tetratricopeptide (TPR) repeat protein